MRTAFDCFRRSPKGPSIDERTSNGVPITVANQSTEGHRMAATCDIGLVGLAVMGENLVLNIESRGFTAAVFNRTTSKVDEFISGRGKGKKFVGCHTLEELVKSLKRPRRVMFMVKAGPAVDQVIAQVAPLLEA